MAGYARLFKPVAQVTCHKFLKVEYDGSGVADVKMSRLPVNAVNVEMYIEIAALFSDPDQIGEGLQVIVLSADGNNFCAGNDLDEFMTMTPANADERMRVARAAFFAIEDCVVPVIGAIHGVALGSGLAIAASCDFIVAARDAMFGLPELTVGVLGGASHLARLAPQSLVRRMFFTGESIRADQLAKDTGALLICDRSELLSTAHTVAERVASFSPIAIRFGKKVLNQIENMDTKTGYELEQRFTAQLSGHPDSKEAVNAFREKRRAKYLSLGEYSNK